MPKTSPNPWLRRAAAQRVDVELVPEPAPALAEDAQLRPIAQPGLRGGLVDRPAAKVVTTDAPDVSVWWVGAHGGAGESTLEQLVPQSRAAERAWPLAASELVELRPRVAIVARTTASGLRAAQQLTCEWATGELDVELLGLVLVADAAGRLPRPLRELAMLVRGGAPEVWEVPWVEAWRTEPPSLATTPRAVRKVVDDFVSRFPNTPTPHTHNRRGRVNAGQS